MTETKRWSEKSLEERVITLRNHYERLANGLYPDGVPMEAYKTDTKRHELYGDYLNFISQLQRLLDGSV